MGEIDNLISELQTLRRKLQTDGDRIQRDIAEHAELSQQVMQLTKIISDSVKKLPGAPHRVVKAARYNGALAGLQRTPLGAGCRSTKPNSRIP
jgi:hypothetical protein